MIEFNLDMTRKLPYHFYTVTVLYELGSFPGTEIKELFVWP